MEGNILTFVFDVDCFRVAAFKTPKPAGGSVGIAPVTCSCRRMRATFSTIVSCRAQCIALVAAIADGCCTIYDNVTHNCTVARTDRFQLVPNASPSLEVGIDSVLLIRYSTN